MRCRIQDLRNKDVICISDATVLGPVCDVEVDTQTANVLALIIYGRPKWCGLLGREDDIVIPWCDIEIIGEDAVLVNCAPARNRRRRRFYRAFFRLNKNF